MAGSELGPPDTGWKINLRDPTEHAVGPRVEFDQTSDGRTLKMLNVIDEYTSECPAIVVARSHRFDNGGEFIAQAVSDWCRFNCTDTVFIDYWRIDYNNNRPQLA